MIVYGVYKNSDMTEGRGPMVLDKLFLDREKAISYMDDQLGPMGVSGKIYSKKLGRVLKGWSEHEYGDWQLKELHVIE